MDDKGGMQLLKLARDNKVAEVEELVRLGVPVDFSNPMGQTALHVASLWGNVETVQKLLELGADPNIENSRLSVPLHFAANARNNALLVCQLLLQHGARTDAVDMQGRLPHMSAETNDVRVLLGGPDDRLFEYCAAPAQVPALQQMLASRMVSTVRVVDKMGRTPLNIAIACQNVLAVQAILDFDKDALSMPDAKGNTPLHEAVESGSLQLVEFLLQRGPPIDAQNFNMSEYAQGDWLMDGEQIVPFDKTPLHVAVENGEPDIVQSLLAAGANPDIVDFDDRSPLHMALEMQDWTLISLLLDAQADVNLSNKDFTSPLHLLSQRGDTQMFERLLEAGADPKCVNADGWTPLHLCSRAGKEGKMRLLLDKGADIHAQNSVGSTALHLASVNGHLEAVRLLLSRGADKSIPNKDGKLAVQMANTDAIVAALA